MTHYPLSLRPAPDLERARLRLLEVYHDPPSAPLSWTQLVSARVGVALMSAPAQVRSRGCSLSGVGISGSVLSVDLDTTLLEEQLASDRVEVRRHDLMSDQLPPDAFDFITAGQSVTTG